MKEGRKVHFCFPGKSFTDEFLESIIYMLTQPPPHGLRGAGLVISYHIEYSSDIYSCRNNLVRTHPHTLVQSRSKVLDGFDYDYMFWIDSDQKWFGEDVLRLLDHDVEVASGLVPIGINQKTCVGRYRLDDGKPYISYFSIPGLLKEERDEKGLVEVDFTGFGFVCVKRGVFEKLGYPWFKTVIHDWDAYEFMLDAKLTDRRSSLRIATSEDIGWCSRAKKEAGAKIYVDPDVRIGHKKEMLLRAEGYESAN